MMRKMAVKQMRDGVRSPAMSEKTVARASL